MLSGEDLAQVGSGRTIMHCCVFAAQAAGLSRSQKRTRGRIREVPSFISACPFAFVGLGEA